MKTRAAVAFAAKQPLEIVELDLEGPKAGEVLVEIMATGICHTDAYTLGGLDSEGLFPSVLDPTYIYVACVALGVLAATGWAAQLGMDQTVPFMESYYTLVLRRGSAMPAAPRVAPTNTAPVTTSAATLTSSNPT